MSNSDLTRAREHPHEARAQIAYLLAALAAMRRDHGAQATELACARYDTVLLRRQLDEANAKATESASQLESAHIELTSVTESLDGVVVSRSWRSTRLLRDVARLFRRPVPRAARKPAAVPDPKEVARLEADDEPGHLHGGQRWRAGSSKVLIIDDGVPLAWRGAGYPRAARLVESLVREGHYLTLFPMHELGTSWSDVRTAVPDQVETMLGWGASQLAEFLAQRRGFYDVVVVSRPSNMTIVNEVLAANPDRVGHAALIYDAEAVVAPRDAMRERLKGIVVDPLDCRVAIAKEIASAAAVDAVICVSDAEARMFAEVSDSIHVVGHALDVSPTPAGFAEREGFLFVGALLGVDTPNTDSVEWFVREVWPQVVATLGRRAHLTIVGTCEVDAIWQLVSPTITVVGAVGDVRPFQNTARIQIVPTRYAAGLPYKAHEAAAHGIPMVTTDLIAGQLRWGDVVANADSPDDFAKACIALHEDPEKWSSSRNAQLGAVRRDCDPAVFEAALRTVMENVSSGPVGSVS